jgi:hypothetical protein
VAYARLARGSQPVQVCAADQDGLGAQRQRGGDVAAAPEAGVHQDF